jgi:hypothetical protein
MVPPVALTVGLMLTVTVSVFADDTQFWAEMPVTVYTVVLAGVTVADPLE